MKEFLRKIDVGNISFISTDLTGALEGKDGKADSYDIKLYGRLTKVRLRRQLSGNYDDTRSIASGYDEADRQPAVPA